MRSARHAGCASLSLGFGCPGRSGIASASPTCAGGPRRRRACASPDPLLNISRFLLCSQLFPHSSARATKSHQTASSALQAARDRHQSARTLKHLRKLGHPAARFDFMTTRTLLHQNRLVVRNSEFYHKLDFEDRIRVFGTDQLYCQQTEVDWQKKYTLVFHRQEKIALAQYP